MRDHSISNILAKYNTAQDFSVAVSTAAFKVSTPGWGGDLSVGGLLLGVKQILSETGDEGHKAIRFACVLCCTRTCVGFLDPRYYDVLDYFRLYEEHTGPILAKLNQPAPEQMAMIKVAHAERRVLNGDSESANQYVAQISIAPHRNQVLQSELLKWLQ